MKVSEIFASIEGEGIRSGLPCTFIRLHGCNLNCSYCDSRYACDGIDFTVMTIDEIVNKVKSIGIMRTTITGGEPLIHENIYDLINALLEIPEMEINIETNGSVLFDYNVLGNNKDKRIIITMDWKSISSGMSDKMQSMNLCYMNEHDVLKFVVGSIEDLQQMKSIISENEIEAQVFVSPIFGKIEPKDIVEFILEEKLDVRVQLQIHKIIWDPNQRGV